MKKFYLGLGLVLSLSNTVLFGMEQTNKDHVIITIHDSKGKEVAVEVDRSQQDSYEQKSWWKRLSKNKKIVLGLSAITGICAGFDAYNCAFNGCSLSGTWEHAAVIGCLCGYAAEKITQKYGRLPRAALGTATFVMLGFGCLYSGIYAETTAFGNIAYLASVLFEMNSKR